MGVETKAPNPLALRLGARVQKLRKSQGMKQETLAHEAGYGSRSAIASIENGMVLPSVDKVLDIARVLGVHPGELLDDEGFNVSAVQRLLLWAQTRCPSFAMTLRALADELDQLATTR